VTTGIQIRAEEYAPSVVLPCEIRDLRELVVIWKKVNLKQALGKVKYNLI
jgi:hypothetical protein